MLTNSQIVSSSPEVIGGTLVFAGTRVPIQTFWDYLKAGESIDDFLAGFPTVVRAQVTSSSNCLANHFREPLGFSLIKSFFATELGAVPLKIFEQAAAS